MSTLQLKIIITIIIRFIRNHNKKDDESDELTSDDQQNNNYEKIQDKNEHLEIGKEFMLRVTILQIIGISKDYDDVFCQFINWNLISC